ncbi:MAG: hypothetical protein RIM84_16925 [Alphaproteobacteria bacterium]
MSFAKMLVTALFLGGLSLGLAACDDANDGPAEKLGEAVDEAASDTKRALEDAAD